MGEAEIRVASGVSWLQSQLTALAEDRVATLQEGIAEGVPLEEYRQMVGRYKEAKRQLTIVIPELFKEFYQAEETEDEELGELKDE